MNYLVAYLAFSYIFTIICFRFNVYGSANECDGLGDVVGVVKGAKLGILILIAPITTIPLMICVIPPLFMSMLRGIGWLCQPTEK